MGDTDYYPKKRGRSSPRVRTTPKSLEIRERAGEALELRKSGMGYDEIALKMGLANRSVAFKAVARAIDLITREPAEEVLKLELERLDARLSVFLPKALGGDIRADERVQAIQDRRAKYLGLDKLTLHLEQQPAPEALWSSVDEWLANPTPELVERLERHGWRRTVVETEGETV